MRFLKPTLPPLAEVLSAYSPNFADGQITNAALVSNLESAVAERLNVRHAVAVSSCTSGLILTMRALDLSGEVILPSFTFFATAHAVSWNNLTPVFADCLPETWTLDPAQVEARITNQTCAILGVHLYGNPCHDNLLSAIAARHNLKLLYDAAHAFGSAYQTRPVGGLGDAEIFSLSPTKLLVAGEGGLITTNDAILARRLRAARNYGDTGAYDPELCGLSARMSEFNAALAISGLDLVDDKVARHNEIAERYTRHLAGLRGVEFQTILPGDISTYKDFSISIDPQRFGMSRDTLANTLEAQGIPTKKYFHPPVHRQRLYAHMGAGPLPITNRVSSGILSLPIYQSLTNEQVDQVAEAILEAHELATQPAAMAGD